MVRENSSTKTWVPWVTTTNLLVAAPNKNKSSNKYQVLVDQALARFQHPHPMVGPAKKRQRSNIPASIEVVDEDEADVADNEE